MSQRINHLENSKQICFRSRWFPWIWRILLPVRIYLKSFPIQHGKGIILRNLLIPLLPPEADFEMPLPGGGVIVLRYRETIGFSSLIYGTFERNELDFVRQYICVGDNVMDIGANVGIYTVLMNQALGDKGRVFAFEPLPENIQRLKNNLELNGCDKALVFDCALGEIEGAASFHLSADPAYSSLLGVKSGFANGELMSVETRCLDHIWQEYGKPRISFIKIDVEGAEPLVIRGASELISDCLPTMMIEANSQTEFKAINSLLEVYGYKILRPQGFSPHNYIFIHPNSGRNLAIKL